MLSILFWVIFTPFLLVGVAVVWLWLLSMVARAIFPG